MHQISTNPILQSFHLSHCMLCCITSCIFWSTNIPRNIELNKLKCFHLNTKISQNTKTVKPNSYFFWCTNILTVFSNVSFAPQLLQTTPVGEDQAPRPAQCAKKSKSCVHDGSVAHDRLASELPEDHSKSVSLASEEKNAIKLGRWILEWMQRRIVFLQKNQVVIRTRNRIKPRNKERILIQKSSVSSLRDTNQVSQNLIQNRTGHHHISEKKNHWRTTQTASHKYFYFRLHLRPILFFNIGFWIIVIQFQFSYIFKE